MSNNDAKLEDNLWLFIVIGLLRDCGKELGTCRDQAKIMYAWARNASPTKLPKGAHLSAHHFSLFSLSQSSWISLAHITYKWSWVNGSYLKSNKSTSDLLHLFFFFFQMLDLKLEETPELTTLCCKFTMVMSTISEVNTAI